MNKLDLIRELKGKCQLTQTETLEIVDLFFFEVSNALIKGDRIEIRGLCSFSVKQYKSYTGRNPKTGEKVTVGSKKLPFFKCGKKLKERVNNNG